MWYQKRIQKTELNETQLNKIRVNTAIHCLRSSFSADCTFTTHYTVEAWNLASNCQRLSASCHSRLIPYYSPGGANEHPQRMEFLRLKRVCPKTASRSVHPLLQGSLMYSTDRHTGHASATASCMEHQYISWQWRNFVPYLCQLIFAVIL